MAEFPTTRAEARLMAAAISQMEQIPDIDFDVVASLVNIKHRKNARAAFKKLFEKFKATAAESSDAMEGADADEADDGSNEDSDSGNDTKGSKKVTSGGKSAPTKKSAVAKKSGPAKKSAPAKKITPAKPTGVTKNITKKSAAGKKATARLAKAPRKTVKKVKEEIEEDAMEEDVKEDVSDDANVDNDNDADLDSVASAAEAADDAEASGAADADMEDNDQEAGKFSTNFSPANDMKAAPGNHVRAPINVIEKALNDPALAAIVKEEDEAKVRGITVAEWRAWKKQNNYDAYLQRRANTRNSNHDEDEA